MACTLEVQLGAWHLCCCGQDQQPLFLEMLFRTYTNALTWLRVQFGIQQRENAFWCLGNQKENGRRYDMLAVRHSFFSKLCGSLDIEPTGLFTRLDGLNAAARYFAVDKNAVLEYFDHVATFCFDCTQKLPGGQEGHRDILQDGDSGARFKRQTTDRDRSIQRGKAASETVKLFKMSPTAQNPCHSDELRKWKADDLHADRDVFGVDLKTRFEPTEDARASFLLDMADAHSFKNVTLLFYLRSEKLNSSFFENTGLWFLNTNAWDLGAMLAVKDETTVTVTGSPQNVVDMATEVVKQRSFFVFDEDVFRKFTNIVYNLNAHTGSFEPEDNLKRLLSLVLNKHRS